MKISLDDYITIAKHYGLKIPLTKKTKKDDYRKLKKNVHTLLAEKLCRCIKSVQKKSRKSLKKGKKYKENRAIAICNKSIFKNRGMKHYRFTCKKKKKLYRRKGVVLSKTKKVRFLHPYKRKLK